jgi:hypothetical protein
VLAVPAIIPVERPVEFQIGNGVGIFVWGSVETPIIRSEFVTKFCLALQGVIPGALIPPEDSFQEQVVVQAGKGDVIAKTPEEVVIQRWQVRGELESSPYKDVDPYLQLQKLRKEEKQRELVSQSLQRLKKQSRDLLMMYYYAELSIVDIAKKLWVSRRRPYAGGYERLSNSSST